MCRPSGSTQSCTENWKGGGFDPEPPLYGIFDKRYSPDVQTFVHRGSYDSMFHSKLDHDGNLCLDLQVRAHLRPHVPEITSSGFGYEQLLDRMNPFGVRVVEWPGGETGTEWREWRARFVPIIEGFWNDRLWLVSVPASPIPPRRQALPAIKCSTHVTLTDDRSHAHLRAEVYRIYPGEHPARAHAPLGGHSRPGEPNMFLCDRDLDPRNDGSGEAGQIVACHEYGHFLGLYHSNPGPDIVRNSDLEYGALGTERRRNIMGVGMELHDWNAWPWLHRLQLHDIDRGLPPRLCSYGTTWRGTCHRPISASPPGAIAPRRI